MENQRPDFIRHYSDLMETYGPGDDAAMFGRKLGLKRLGINFEILAPGGQTAPPHAHEKDEEFVFVLDGAPTSGSTEICIGLRPVMASPSPTAPASRTASSTTPTRRSD